MMHHVLRLSGLFLIFVVHLAAQVKKPPDPVLDEFRQYIGDKDALVRAEQVERLGRSQTAESVQLLITKGLMDGDSRVQERAIRTIAKFESPEARAALLQGLQHTKSEVRAGIMLGLAGQKDWSALPTKVLTGVLTGDRIPEVRSAAAEALSQLGRKDAIPDLGKALGDRDPDVTIAAADALALLVAGSEVVPALAPLLDSPNWRVQLAAVNANFRKGIARMTAACFFVNILAVLCVKNTFKIFDASRFQGILKA